MIRDNIQFYKEYNQLSENVIKGLDYLSQTNFDELEDGKYHLEGIGYVNIQTYTTKSDANFEAHREYIDIQYIIKGLEKIEVAEYANCKTVTQYDTNNDIEFLSGEGEYFELFKNDFMILYPTDAHKPSISVTIPTAVRKAVVKVKI